MSEFAFVRYLKEGSRYRITDRHAIGVASLNAITLHRSVHANDCEFKIDPLPVILQLLQTLVTFHRRHN